MNLMDNITIYCISHRPKLVYQLKQLIPNLIHFDGTNAVSFSNLINKCIITCPTEYIIILSDKVRPKPGQINKLISLVFDPTIAFASMHRFAAFGFSKNLIRTIGFFDERYIPGGYEDDDFMIRLREGDLKFYETEEMPIIQMSSSFNYTNAAKHFNSKWKILNNKIIRLLPETTYYYIGPIKPNIGVIWGKWNNSYFGVKGHHCRNKYSKIIVNSRFV